MRCFWTTEEEKVIHDLHRKGYTVVEITRVFPNRTANAVRMHMEDLGLKPNRPTPAIDLDLYHKMMEVKHV